MASEEEREVVRVKVKVGSLKQVFSLCLPDSWELRAGSEDVFTLSPCL